MKIDLDVLRRYVDLPGTPVETRHLLDDLGIEVKRFEDGLDSSTFTVELLANRGDHYCYEGVAREVSGRTGAGVTRPPIARLTSGESPWPVLIETALCPRYSATLLVRGDERPLSRDELRPLLSAGLGSVHPVVDATNLANLELGQPTHAFDADTLDGAIRVRLSREGEAAWPLFTEEPIALPAGLVVIADDSKILAIAGVIGCEESKTTEATTRVLLESAAFDPVSVRKASRRLGIHTDSSARFERGSDFSRVIDGAGRVVHLMERAGWERQGCTGDHGDWRDPGRVVGLDIVAAASFLEYPLTEEEVQDRLTRYGFEVSSCWPDWPEGWSSDHVERDRRTVLVKVPPVRLWDVENSADLIEELAKSIGYNATPTRLPDVDQGAVPSRRETVRVDVEEVLLGAGFYEVITNGFHGRDLTDKLGLTEDHPLSTHVSTENALERAYSLLKNSAFPQAVEAVASNLRRREGEIRAFEWTRTFQRHAGAENGLCDEHHVLWAIVAGHDGDPDWTNRQRVADAHFMAGLVSEIGTALGLPLRVRTDQLSDRFSGLLHPGRRADIWFQERLIGALGEVHPAVRQAFKLGKVRPVYLELDEHALLGDRHPIRYVEPSIHHDIVRNLAFTLPAGVYSRAILDTLADHAPSWFMGAKVVDRFDHDADGRSVSTLTFELRFAPGDAGRTAEEVNGTCEHLVEVVVRRHGDAGVSLRG